MCNASPSAKVGSGQPTKPARHPFDAGARASVAKSSLARRSHGLFLYRTQAHPQKLRQPRQRARNPVPPADAEGRLYRFPAGRSPAGKAHHRRPAGRVQRGLPDRLAQRLRRDEVPGVQPGQAGVRRARMPDPRVDLRLGRARQGAADHLRPRVLHAPVEGREGSQGAGGLHGRGAPDDRQGLVHHQRHRARDRVAAAPLAGCLLRARQGQDAQLGQAAVLGAHHPLPRLVAGLRVRPEGRAVLPRRPPPQDAGDDPAEGDRPHARVDPGELLRQRQLPPDGQRRADGVRLRAPARRGRALRHHRQVREGDRRQGQARHRAPHP